MKILVVEDEAELAHGLIKNLELEGHIVELCTNLQTALITVENHFDIIVLDINLPDGSRLEVLRRVKRLHQQTGIIIVSARDSVDNKVEGLELGADDYLIKPFQFAELNARLKSLVRRVHFQGSEIITYHELEVNSSTLETYVNSTKVELTKREYDLLIYFLANKNRVLTKAGIAEHISKGYMDYGFSDDYIYTHIKNLKKKLLKSGCKDYIKNVYGVGYKFTDEN